MLIVIVLFYFSSQIGGLQLIFLFSLIYNDSSFLWLCRFSFYSCFQQFDFAYWHSLYLSCLDFVEFLGFLDL